MRSLQSPAKKRVLEKAKPNSGMHPTAHQHEIYRGRTFGDPVRVVFVEETGGRKIDEIHMSEG